MIRTKFSIAAVALMMMVSSQGFAQSAEPDRDGIEKAKKALEDEVATFNRCLAESESNSCMATLVSAAKNEFEKYIVGGVLFGIDEKQSFQLHQEAYKAKPKNIYFILEYAIELHRAGKFAEAVPLYELYRKEKADDYRVAVWLSECFMNTGQTDKAIENWKMANHADHHTGIDFAIHIVHGETDLVSKRDQYRREFANGNLKAAYPLIFMDLNWQQDWWNTAVNDAFLEADLRLIETRFKPSDPDYKAIKVYEKVKSKSMFNADSLRVLFTANNILLNNAPLPAGGQMTSELLNICLQNGLLKEKEFYETRGKELLSLANDTRDKDLLNIYAYLQAVVDGHVNPDIDKLGWTEFKDDRFAISYFIGKGSDIEVDDPELAQAIKDFPNSPRLYWFRAKAAKVKGLPVKDHLVELIKREFRTLASDQSRNSYRLKNYFGTLEQEKK